MTGATAADASPATGTAAGAGGSDAADGARPRPAPDTTGGHPFPQLRRPRWCALDGPWDFAYDDADSGLEEGWPQRGVSGRTITVPFPPESPRSGVGGTGYHPVVWYSRRLSALDLEAAGAGVQGDRMLLHLGAVDYCAAVWVNGQRIAEHDGGHTPVVVDITHALAVDGRGPDGHLLVVRAEDRPLDAGQPRGKQDWRTEPHDIWYARTTGIWQSVWLEAVPRTAIAEIAWTPARTCEAVELEATTTRPVPAGSRLTVRLSLAGHPLAEVSAHLPETSTAGLTSDLREQSPAQRCGALLWSPAHPRRIDAEVVLAPSSAPLAGERATPAGPGGPAGIGAAPEDRPAAPDAGGPAPDVVSSYLGLRSVGTAGRRFLLNGRPYYVRAVLEQGFWPDSHLAAPDDDARRDEVALIKSLGFNTARIHQKVEDPRMLYWADRLGLLLWGEMAAAYEFTTQSAARLVTEWTAVVRRDRSHPSIVTWAPFNESWGVQRLADRPEQRALSRAVADLTRALDPSRPVVSNDGWEHTCSDIITIHDYDGDDVATTLRYAEADRLETVLDDFGPAGRRIMAQGTADRDLPVMVTEFGGIRYLRGGADADGDGSADGGTAEETSWGYTSAESPTDFEARLRRAFSALQASPHLAGFCYTQLTDTMQEANGLADSRRRPKIDAALIRAIVTAPITS